MTPLQTPEASTGLSVARLWAGPSALPRALSLEWQLVLVRWIGILSVAPALPFANLSGQQLMAAYAIIAFDALFNAAIQIGMPRRPGLFTNGAISMVGDGLITIAMVNAGGGSDSPLAY